ncbi:MAG: sugar phosphate isomerase/epimerase [Pseudomonadota bacterium]|nr:sugar phosphate isomerase/epimerase [Pseudomonadota bacterium]
MSFKYSYDALVYYGEGIDASVARVAKCGYDAIELVGEPSQYDTAHVKRLCAEAKVGVSSICSIFTGPQRDLVNPDARMRSAAVQYCKDVADLAAGVGAPVFILAPSPVGKMAPMADPKQEWQWAIESVREAADYAQSRGVKICIEAWNRYETYFINRIDQALALMRDVDRPNVGVMGDTFHMNIEDGSIPDTIRRAAEHLLHIHFADSNRAAPGKGHTDFKPIMQALRDIGYQGHITFELLPASADPFGTMKSGGGREFFDDYTKLAIDTIKQLEAGM